MSSISRSEQRTGRVPKAKKLLLASTALAALGTAGAGVGTGAASTRPSASYAGQTLTVYLPAITIDIVNTKKFQADVAAAFHAETGATISYSYYNSSSQELTTLETAIASHVGPDVFSLGFTFDPIAYESNAFDRITAKDWKFLGGQSSFLASELTASGPSLKNTVAVPVVCTPHALAYNKLLFKKAGITSPPTTWSEFIADAQKINDPSKGVYGTVIDPADSSDPWKNIWTISAQLGGSFTTASGLPDMDSPINIKAATFWFDWFTKFHIVPPQSLTWTQAEETTAFASGKIGMQSYSQVPFIPTYSAGAIGRNFAFAPMPTIPYGLSKLPKGGIPTESLVSGQQDVIAKYAPTQLALDYVKLITSDKFQVLQWQLERDFPITYSALNEVKKVDPAVLGAFVKSAIDATDLAFSTSIPEVEVAWGSATQKLAAEIASTGSLAHGYVASVLQQENTAATQAVQAGS